MLRDANARQPTPSHTMRFRLGWKLRTVWLRKCD